MSKIAIFAVFFVVFLQFSASFTRIITTSYGELRGRKSIISEDLITFKKIPFAVPPIGDLRFQKPRRVARWEGVLNAEEYGDGCLCNTTLSSSPPATMSEDCLYLNIFTSDYCIRSKDCAVIFYVHGGAMLYDSAIMFNETVLHANFVSKDIVFVIPAYRLGIFSHFTISNQDLAPANLFLWDILLALEFSKSEIHNFGGAAAKTTLFGHSAGGGLVNMILFSPFINNNRELFQKVVSMSLDIPVRERFSYEKMMEFTRELSEMAQCPKNSSISIERRESAMLECLRKVDSLELLKMQRRLEEAHKFMCFVAPMAPFWDGKRFDEVFRHAKNIDYLCGMGVDEYRNDVLQVPLAEIFGFRNVFEVDAKYRSDRANRRLPFNASDETVRQKMSTYQVLKKMHDFGATTYLYEYSYEKHQIHRESAALVLGVHDFEKDENELKLLKVYPELIANFAKYGRPAEDKDWAPYSTRNLNYFDIDWNSSGTKRPGMKFGWENAMITYFFEDLVRFDAEIDEKRRKSANWRHKPTTLFTAILTLLLARMV